MSITTTPTTPDNFETFHESFISAICGNWDTAKFCASVNYDYNSISLEMEEKIKMCLHETQTAYYDAPSDEDGETVEQAAATDAIILEGAKELYQIMY